ncbi:MAG: DUF4430 domain-containing protein [Solirubrobacterales bacterium]|nr:DUF4430 domain-containing protein [Solirubrobacterales bacterium]
MPSRLRLLLAVAAASCAAAASGCGFGSGEAPGGTQLRVTTDFGARPLVDSDAPETGGSDTVMRLLQRNVKDVKTRFGGGFVQEIDGVAGGQSDGRQADWFFYVNGIQSDKGATSVRVHEGDRIWWDHHQWGDARDTPAVVGQFPAPFTRAEDGRRLPVRVECVQVESPACDRVHETLVGLEIPAAKGGVAKSFVQETLRVLVGPWPALREEDTAELLERGPQESGVFARPSEDGKSIALLDADGKEVRSIGPGSGLIAATRRQDAAPVWVVTGTDAAGIEAAAGALQEGALRGRFAVVLERGRVVGVPVRR